MEKPSFIKKTRLFIIAIFLPIIVYLAIKDTIRGNNEAVAMEKEYPDMTYNNSISGEIVKHFSEYGTTYIVLKDKSKYSITNSLNYLYDPYSLFKFIRSGDMVHKQSNSDTLFVQRNDNLYYFIIGEFINEE